jgi:general stress protein YciG
MVEFRTATARLAVTSFDAITAVSPHFIGTTTLALHWKRQRRTSRLSETRVKEKWMAQSQGGRGFASMDEDKQRAIAAKGGHESGGNFRNDPQRAAEAGHKGGQVSGGNFKFNRERAAEAGRKGGLR